MLSYWKFDLEFYHDFIDSLSEETWIEYSNNINAVCKLFIVYK